MLLTLFYSSKRAGMGGGVVLFNCVLFFHHFLFAYLFQAFALVEEETRRYRPTKNYLDYLPPADFDKFEVRSLFREYFDCLFSKEELRLATFPTITSPQPLRRQKPSKKLAIQLRVLICLKMFCSLRYSEYPNSS